MLAGFGGGLEVCDGGRGKDEVLYKVRAGEGKGSQNRRVPLKTAE